MLPTLSFLFASFSLLQDPLEGQLPKRDLGVDAFLAEHPDYDGRGVRVAVLDTGIDPGHPFLQTTPQGGRKIVDWYDATTDGRLDTSTVAEAVDGALTGLSGRRLVLGGHRAEDGDYHLGRLSAAFLPGDLAGRIQGDRRAEWEKGRAAFEEARLRREHESGDAAPEGPRQEAIAQKWERFEDHGPVYDVVAFRSGGAWKVVVDSDEDGELGEERALGGFRATGDWATLGDEALLNYAVQVEAGGDRTVFFFDTNGHGTHVAGIVGAWEGPDGRLNGIAPGVEFVAIKIGDGKFGGSTSGFAIAKALDYAVESGCQVVNMSFGGPSFFADGHEPDAWVIEEATRRGLAVVTSAGNEGPTLTTVGAPATSRAAFAIAAAVWPDTQRSNYASMRPSGPVLFDFSSRGPLPSGDLGVDFTAPGAAVSALPSWLITPAENFNGTSMASPQAAGCVALLISAARAEGLPAGPERLRRAMRLGAQPMEGHAWVEQGHGAIRMLPSLAALRTLDDHGAEETVWEVRAQNPFGAGAGVYERDLTSRTPFERTVSLRPVFAEEAANAEKAAFRRTLRVVSESDWVLTPDAVYTSAMGARFAVTVDPSGLAAGLHSTRVLLFDADRPEEVGAELVVPVTVVVPESTSAAHGHEYRKQVRLEPGQLERSFLRVPHGATAATVELLQHGAGRNEYRTGAGSVSGFRYAGDRQARGRWFLDDGDSVEQTVPVEPGTVFEYTVASRWAVNRAADLEIRVRFHGLAPQQGEMVAPAGQGIAYLALKAPLAAVDARASASIDGVAIPVTAPMEIVPDPIRATVMGGRGMFQGRVEWQVEIPEGGARVGLHTPHSIQTTEIREDLMLEIFDAQGAVVGRHIAYEVETELGRLDAGSYTFLLRYPSLGKEALESRYAGAEVLLYGNHPAPTLYADLDEALKGGAASSAVRVPYAGARTVYARIPELAALPAGQRWFGHLSVREGGVELVRVPLRVLRPQLEAPAADAEAADAEAEDAAEPGAEARAAFEAALVDEAVDAAGRLAKARAWAEAAPASAEAELALLRQMAAAGLADFAAARAAGFLDRFPQAQEAFLAAAAAWNG